MHNMLDSPAWTLDAITLHGVSSGVGCPTILCSRRWLSTCNASNCVLRASMLMPVLEGFCGCIQPQVSAMKQDRIHEQTHSSRSRGDFEKHACAVQ